MKKITVRYSHNLTVDYGFTDNQLQDFIRLLRNDKPSYWWYNIQELGDDEYIKTSNNFIVLIDKEDKPRLSQYGWFATSNNYTHYAIATRRFDGKKHTIRMHRLLTNAPKDMECDHINRNGLDNRKRNLRMCTPSQNMCNQGKRKMNQSGYKGVFYHQRSGKWFSQIRHNGKKICLGYFSNKEDARDVYIKKSQELRGSFAEKTFLNKNAQNC